MLIHYSSGLFNEFSIHLHSSIHFKEGIDDFDLVNFIVTKTIQTALSAVCA